MATKLVLVCHSIFAHFAWTQNYFISNRDMIAKSFGVYGYQITTHCSLLHLLAYLLPWLVIIMAPLCGAGLLQRCCNVGGMSVGNLKTPQLTVAATNRL